MFNFFNRNKKAETPMKKIGIRQHRRVFVDKKVEQYTKQLNTRSLGLVGDRIDAATESQTITGSINSAIKGSAQRLYNQGRTLALNTSIGARYAQHVVDQVVGTGLSPKTFIMKGGKLDTETNTMLENAFWRWAGSQKRFSRNGKLNFLELLKMCEKERVMGGEAFVVLHDEGRDLQVSVLGADKCDWTDCRKLDNGNTVYQGIEYDSETIRPVAYWFRRYDLFTQTFTGEKYRVEAEKVLHYYIPATAEALRGVTDFLPVIKDIAHMDAFRETAIIQKRIAASSMGFIERPKAEGNDFDTGEDEDNYQPPSVVTDFEPGTIQELEAGATIKSIQATQGGDDFDKFNEAMLTAVSMGLSSYKTALTGDTSSVNYSAARFGALMERNRFKGNQDRLIDIVVMPLFEAFLNHAVLHSLVNIRMTQIDNIILNTTVIRPKYESVDPIKDINAEVMLIEKGLKSRSAVIMERGEDPVQVFKEIEAEKEHINIHVASDGEKKSPESQE
ncbi:phage portal protein [Salmonella enterica]|nr:phage portal protein [Salmonella enterica]ECC3491876.1 phage portal protein [Salmonella enterica subsp. enterica serovar 4,[5],12:i:-]ECE0247948.1 phage portal protein [Salmonella enterica subsp. enterica serovar 4,12:i:-]ECS6950470.1 phage portal protein [Salmonella enterica subsp. enterica serovar Litchfield]EDO3164212.1 phage portal protein [Salmonella enterica subsp. enterica serovar Newport]EDO3796002.1 phage portal protein [Salmonella enterica subsp. enterica serovar Enteritidis]EDU7